MPRCALVTVRVLRALLAGVLVFPRCALGLQGMENPRFCRYSCLDFVFTLVGVCSYLLDVGSDLWVAAEFYLHGDLLWFGLVVGFVVLSSVTVHVFSWFWFKYDRELEGFTAHSSAEKVLFGGEGILKLSLLHVFQLGFLLRHLSAVEQGLRVWWFGKKATQYVAYVTHDLSMLRLIEAFCESAPQLTILLYIMLHTGHARTFQWVSVAASSTSIAWTVLMYHRSLRSFLPDKAQQRWTSSALYFLWNLLLIAPRIAALALFGSALPLLVPAHFLCLWLPLLLWAWLQRTDFMDSAGGEWLYRGAVALIWYFSWFNVSEGRSRWRAGLHHALMAVDGGILLASWWTLRDEELTQSYALALLISLPAAHVLGLLLKGLYYSCFHPTLCPLPVRREEDEPDTAATLRPLPPQAGPSPAHITPPSPLRPLPPQAGPSPQLCNKRMASLANIFYTAVPPLPWAWLPSTNTSNDVI